MGDDDAEARRKRAEALREQISELKGARRPKEAAPEEASHEPERRHAPQSDPTPGNSAEEGDGRREPPRVRPLSPRDFIERRMRDLDAPGDEKD
ncbi:MAG TPA: hypothetical protein VGC68_06980 [Enterovirga sp.]|jgi:hypothetical protein